MQRSARPWQRQKEHGKRRDKLTVWSYPETPIIQVVPIWGCIASVDATYFGLFIQIIPMLGFRVCKWYLLWAVWS